MGFQFSVMALSEWRLCFMICRDTYKELQTFQLPIDEDPHFPGVYTKGWDLGHTLS